MTTHTAMWHEFTTRRAAEERVKGNESEASVYARFAFANRPLATMPGPTLAQWQAWHGDRMPNQLDALAFLDWCAEQGIVNDEQMVAAANLVRLRGDNWLTDELTNLARAEGGNATA